MGRLTKDPEIRYSQGDDSTAIARYSIAVDRRVRAQNGEQAADFINIVAFGKGGEFAEKYLKKGMKVLITGRIQTGSYTNRDGVKVYTTDIVAEDQEFCEKKEDAERPAPADANGFMNVPDDDDLPFGPVTR
jgi:single-strand DNA-binding protein